MNVSNVASSSTNAPVPAAAAQETAGMLAMRKAMEAQKSEGESLLKLMEQSAGLGQKLDTTA